jgi:hypothetical protein
MSGCKSALRLRPRRALSSVTAPPSCTPSSLSQSLSSEPLHFYSFDRTDLYSFDRTTTDPSRTTNSVTSHAAIFFKRPRVASRSFSRRFSISEDDNLYPRFMRSKTRCSRADNPSSFENVAAAIHNAARTMKSFIPGNSAGIGPSHSSKLLPSPHVAATFQVRRGFRPASGLSSILGMGHRRDTLLQPARSTCRASLRELKPQSNGPPHEQLPSLLTTGNRQTAPARGGNLWPQLRC